MVLCQRAERYEDMTKYAEELVKLKKKLTKKERNLFTVAFKNVVSKKRSAWRTYSCIANKIDEKGEDTSVVEMLKKEVGEELLKVCDIVIGLINDRFLSEAKEAEEIIFYLKMLGDYYRYKFEGSTWVEQYQLAKLSETSYVNASRVVDNLLATNPVRLGLALNMSVFYYEIMNDVQTACKIAKDAFDNALAGLDYQEEENYEDTTLIMQLLKDNFTLWMSKNDNQAESK